MSWWRRLLSRKRMEAELDKELRFHLEQRALDLQKQGHDAGAAKRLARMELGGPEQVKEVCRDVRGTRWVEDIWQDCRYAARTLRRRPGFLVVALLTLALGTGATTVIFSLIDGVLLKPLPYPHANRLLRLQEKTDWKNAYGDIWAFAYPNLADCRRETRSLDIAGFQYDGGVLREPHQAEYADSMEITANFFPVLGASMYRGRGFLPDDDRLGAPPVAIISHSLWQRAYGADPQWLGKSLVFGGKTYTIVGIAPPDFQFLGDTFDVFTLLGQDPSPLMERRDRHPGIGAIARLRPGATQEAAQTELTLVGRRLAEAYPSSNRGRTFIAEPLRMDLGDASSTLWLLMGAVTLVLLIACVNVASILLARAVARERELAMRAALGAGRGRLARQCLTESALLGVAGGLLGILFAAAGLHPFVTFWPNGLPRASEVGLDWRVLGFALSSGLICGVLFGWAPALRVPRSGLDRVLRAGSRTVAGGSRRLHGGLVVLQIAMALILLVAAGTLGRALLQLAAVNPGIDIHHLLTARAALSPSAFSSPGRTRAAWDEFLRNAANVPGVRAVALVDTVPMREGYNEIGFWTSPSMPAADRIPLGLATSVTPGYLKVMGLRLLGGRFFTDQDRQGAGHVVVIDDVLARQAFGTENTVGKQLWIPGNSSPFTVGSEASDAARVIGVVGHVQYWGPAGDAAANVRAEIYYPLAQVADPLMKRWSDLMSVAVRTSVAPLSVVEPLRAAVQGAAGDQALYEIRTMEQLAAAQLARQRFLLLLFGVFASLAMLLACVGIHGVLAYLTAQRIPEFGVRMALGATGRDVVRLVLRQSLGMIAAGVALGAAGAWLASRLLERSVAGVQSTPVSTFGLMVLMLAAAALLASFLPARRASRVDPVAALRQE